MTQPREFPLPTTPNSIPNFLLGVAQPASTDSTSCWLLHTGKPRFLAVARSARPNNGVHLLVAHELDDLREHDEELPFLMERAATFIRRDLGDPHQGPTTYAQGARGIDVPPFLLVSSMSDSFFGVLKVSFPYVLIKLDPEAMAQRREFLVDEFHCAHTLTGDRIAQITMQASEFLQGLVSTP